MVDTLAKKLVRKMKNFAPDFAINTCFRSIKISNIYSYTFKPKAEIPETPDCIYHFQCECSEDYIGQSKRKLIVRVREHQQKSRKTAIWSHIQSCNAYKSKFKFFKKPNTDPNISEKQLALEKQKVGLSNDKLKFKYFASHFKILQKNFRSLDHRMDAEAFFIRMKQPKLNKQEELSFFELF